MDAVVKKYNEEHVSRTTKMTPNQAAEPENKAKVKNEPGKRKAIQQSTTSSSGRR